VVDTSNRRIRKINTSGVISTVAGNGSFGFSGDGGAATDASLADPTGVFVDTAGNLYIADTNNQRIRKVDLVRLDLLVMAVKLQMQIWLFPRQYM